MAANAVTYSQAAAITKSDTVNYPQVGSLGPAVAIYVGTVTGATGTIAAVLPNGVAVSLIAATAGAIIPIQTIRVNSTGTDATNLVALWQV